jgi:hypothetical protein
MNLGAAPALSCFALPCRASHFLVVLRTSLRSPLRYGFAVAHTFTRFAGFGTAPAFAGLPFASLALHKSFLGLSF